MRRWQAGAAALAALLLGLAAGCKPAAPLAESAATSAAYDPTAAAAAERARGRIGNVLAHIPPQCYTAVRGRAGEAPANPCWVCHTGANGHNRADDWPLQEHYQFNAMGRSNHWSNLFVDRGPAIAAQTDAEILAYVRQDNYASLQAALAQLPAERRPRWVPDLDAERGFAADGLARDGSGWRAYRYQPFPGTFWPTNGAADDALIRLPAAFRENAAGQLSASVYRVNLAIVEAAVAVPDTRASTALNRPVEPLDETAAGFDLDGDGHLGTATRISVLPAHYAGAAASVPVRRWHYPVGTEFMHGVYYLDPAAPDLRARRLKELRYARKLFDLDDAHLAFQYAEDAREQDNGGWSYLGGDAFSGLFSNYGWQLQAYIEQADGRLRLQTREEQVYCMGCHSGIGVTVDGSFSLPRKLPGLAGWGRQSLAGQQDRPQAGTDEPEYLRYLRRARGGDEYRANTEMLQRWFPGGVLDEAAVRAADIATLVLPTPARALKLDKAYRALVQTQDFVHGRDALLAPAQHVQHEVQGPDTGLDHAQGTAWNDGRLWLEWPEDSRAPGQIVNK